MLQINYRFLCLMFSVFFLCPNLIAQSVNFEETWKEFLENDKISNMSELDRPNKEYDPLNYIKYLLMNTNSSFCQSDIKRAEELLAAINDIEVRAHQAIPGFVKKKDDLETKVKAYHSIDAIWQRFLQTKEVSLEELESIKSAKSLCEKRTLAKYSYMTAYYRFCRGEVSRSKDIIENRTLRLTEKTTLRVEEVEGLAPELAKMKKLFQNISKLDKSWNNYLETGVSPGFDMELPFFPCYPIPSIKEWVLKGAVDVCDNGLVMLEKIKKAQTESGVSLDGALAKKVKALETAIKEKNTNLELLNEAWEVFISTNEVANPTKYGYEYCSKEPLIRAYIMDGFANACGNAAYSLQQINGFQESDLTALSTITKTKINELQDLYIQLQSEEEDINTLWNKFVAQGDTLYRDYQIADYYCDHVFDVKAWLIKAYMVDCKQGSQYLEQIDKVQEKLDFEFTKDVRCRVNKLRIKIWDCQYQVLEKLAKVQASSDDFEEILAGLVEEYGIGERPVVCSE